MKASLSAALDRIDDLLPTRAPRAWASLAPPASVDALERLARSSFGGALPAELAAWFGWHDGQRGTSAIAPDSSYTPEGAPHLIGLLRRAASAISCPTVGGSGPPPLRTPGMIDFSPRRPGSVAPRETLAHASIPMSQPASSPKAPARVALDPKKRVAKAPKFQPEDVHTFVASLFGEDLHAKRVLSLASGVVGVLHSASLAGHPRDRTGSGPGPGPRAQARVQAGRATASQSWD
jgi:hypothetical protein